MIYDNVFANPTANATTRQNATSPPTRHTHCAACGTQSDSLRTCGGCHATAYCGRDCQRRHWREHKPSCDLGRLGAESRALSEAIHDSDPRPIQVAAEAHSKQIRKMKKSGAPMVSMSMTAFGIVAPGLPVPDGVPTNFALKQKATLELKMGPSSRPGGRGNMKGEGSYRAYYDDLVAHKSTWMAFFDEAGNSEHAEHTCGILGTLATIYRQRGSLPECEEVLDMEAEVLDRYKRSSRGAPIAQVRCCDCLEYKYRVIRYNLNFQRKRYRDCLALFRGLAGYELKYDLDYDEQQWLFMTQVILGKPPTAATLRSLADEEVMEMVLAPLRVNDTPESVLEVEQTKKRVALMKCAACGRSEDSIGTFKTCARCDTGTYYCGRECQKKDWKSHKKFVCKRTTL